MRLSSLPIGPSAHRLDVRGQPRACRATPPEPRRCGSRPFRSDRPLIGWTYVDNLERAVQLLLNRGDAALVPSYRPPGLFQVIVGDRLHDPNWVAINVNRDRYRPARIAHLLSAPPTPPR